MKDIIIGCFNSYLPENIKPWVNSIKKSGFNGDLLAIIYGNGSAEQQSSAYLKNNEFQVVSIPNFTKSIVVDRFRDMAIYLHKNRAKYRYVIATDVGDIVFQTNPSKFLESNLTDKDILVGSECVFYRDETWGRQNMRMSYPAQADMMMDKLIYNAGSIAAKVDAAIDLFVDIYNMSITTSVYNPDQAAMNILVHTKYIDKTNLCSMKQGWSIQCGTVADPNRLKEYGHLLTENEFRFDAGVGYNVSGDKVCLVHQYNRVPNLVDTVRSLYAT